MTAKQTMSLDPDNFQGVRRPLLEAETLPSWCYSDEGFFRLELERLFKPAWRLACRQDEIPQAGDYRRVWTAGGEVFVVRGEDGEIRAFANSCRHRGAQLIASDEGHCKTILCPYHSWSYRLSGDLASAPGMKDTSDFDPAQFGLWPVRLENWGGFLFVNADPNAAPLSNSIGDMMERFEDHRFDELRAVRRVRFSVAANWKLLAENALEAYHTGSVHGETLGQQQAELLRVKGAWTGLVVKDEVSVGTMRGTAPPFPAIKGLSEEAQKETTFTMIYPATQLVCAPDCVWWVDFIPKGPQATEIILGSCFPETTVAQTNFEEAVQPYYERWDLATPEDNDICEAQQRGLAFQDRPPGRFAASEYCVHQLDNWVLNGLLAGPK